MGVPIPISDGPQLISRSVAKPYLVLNNGSNTVYLGTDSSVSPTAYAFPLAPGSAFQWTEISSDVYGVCDKGKASQLVVAPEASAMAFGTLSANIQGTVDVSGSDVGVSGSVDTSGSTVKNRTQSNPVTLGAAATVFSAGMGSPQPLAAIPSLAVSGYSSIIVDVSDNQGGIVPSYQSMIKVVITQTLNGVQVGTPTNAHFLIGACNGYIQVPVIGDSVQVTGQYINQSALIGTISVQVVGSSEVIPVPRYLSYNSGAKGSLAGGGYYNVSTGVVVQDYVTCRNGSAELSILAATGTSAGSANVAVADFDNPGGVIILAGTGSIPAGGAANLSLVLPMRPVYVTTRPTAGTLICSLLQ